MNTNFANPSRTANLDRLENAARHYFTRPPGISDEEIFREKVLKTPYYFMKGATQGGIEILKSLASPLKTAARGVAALKNPKALKETCGKGLKLAKRGLQEFSGHPLDSLQAWGKDFADTATDQVVKFLEAGPEEQSEAVGKLGAQLDFFILSGKFPGAITKASKLEGLTLRRFPLGVKNAGEFRKYTDWILKETQSVLKPIPDKKAFSGIRGSAVTGVRHRGGLFGPKSDLDFFVVSDELFLEGRKRGARGRKGMLYVGDTLKYFKKELAPVEKKISSAVAKDLGTPRKASIRIFSQKGFEQIAQGAGKELVRKPGAGFWLRHQLANWWSSVMK